MGTIKWIYICSTWLKTLITDQLDVAAALHFHACKTMFPSMYIITAGLSKFPCHKQMTEKGCLAKDMHLQHMRLHRLQPSNELSVHALWSIILRAVTNSTEQHLLRLRVKALYPRCTTRPNPRIIRPPQQKYRLRTSPHKNVFYVFIMRLWKALLYFLLLLATTWLDLQNMDLCICITWIWR